MESSSDDNTTTSNHDSAGANDDRMVPSNNVVEDGIDLLLTGAINIGTPTTSKSSSSYKEAVITSLSTTLKEEETKSPPRRHHHLVGQDPPGRSTADPPGRLEPPDSKDRDSNGSRIMGTSDPGLFQTRRRRSHSQEPTTTIIAAAAPLLLMRDPSAKNLTTSYYQEELDKISHDINATFAFLQESKKAISRVTQHNKVMSQRNLLALVEDDDEKAAEQQFIKAISKRNLFTDQEDDKSTVTTSKRKPSSSNNNKEVVTSTNTFKKLRQQRSLDKQQRGTGRHFFTGTRSRQHRSRRPREESGGLKKDGHDDTGSATAKPSSRPRSNRHSTRSSRNTTGTRDNDNGKTTSGSLSGVAATDSNVNPAGGTAEANDTSSPVIPEQVSESGIVDMAEKKTEAPQNSLEDIPTDRNTHLDASHQDASRDDSSMRGHLKRVETEEEARRRRRKRYEERKRTKRQKGDDKDGHRRSHRHRKKSDRDRTESSTSSSRPQKEQSPRSLNRGSANRIRSTRAPRTQPSRRDRSTTLNPPSATTTTTATPKNLLHRTRSRSISPRASGNEKNNNNSNSKSPTRKENTMARMKAVSKIYLSHEPSHFLDSLAERKEIRTLGRKLAELEQQLQDVQAAEIVELQVIQQAHQHAASNKSVLKLLQLEQQAYIEQNKHAKNAIFTLHQDTMALEKAHQETFALYKQIERIHAGEVAKYTALTKHLPLFEENLEVRAQKIRRRTVQIEWEHNVTMICEKYMAKLLAHFQEHCKQPDLVARLGELALGDDAAPKREMLTNQERQTLLKGDDNDKDEPSEDETESSSSDYGSSSEYETHSEDEEEDRNNDEDESGSEYSDESSSEEEYKRKTDGNK
jgi:hypothetical protein